MKVVTILKRSNATEKVRRKCGNCQGKGFTFDGREWTEDKWGGFKMVNVKQQCSKCHGRGVK